jgi:DNA-binding transcriptional LysR family regulator
VLNLRSVDLNLLPVFEAAYEERSLSRAAERLAMTQPAVSHALTRLRALFKDELFVRQSRGVMPTPAADAIYARLHTALGSVRETVNDARGFDPATSARRFFVTIPHPAGPLMALRLQAHLEASAPNVSIAFSTRSRPIELERGLREGRIDAAVDWLSLRGTQFQETVLFEEDIVAVARDRHPALRKSASLRTLQDGGFVVLRPRVEGESQQAGIRAWERLDLNVVLEVSEFLEVLMVASRSDLFGIIPRSLARIGRETFGVRVLPATPKTPAVAVKLLWNARRTSDPAHAYLRQALAEAAREVI